MKRMVLTALAGGCLLTMPQYGLAAEYVVSDIESVKANNVPGIAVIADGTIYSVRASSSSDNTLTLTGDFLLDFNINIIGSADNIQAIYNGYGAGNTDANNNTLIIEKNVQITNLYNVHAGFSAHGIASGNKLYLNSGSVNASNVSAGLGEYAYNNTVSVNNVSTSLSNNGTLLAGGYGQRDAENNTTNITNSLINFDLISGGAADRGNANSNKVNISGSTVKNVVGGNNRGVSGLSGMTVNNNTVTISNSTVDGYVYGGTSLGTDSTVSNNIVTLYDNVKITDTLGGYSTNAYVTNHSGNILNIRGLGSEAADLKNFDIINFYVPDSVTSGSNIFKINGGTATLTGTTINGYFDGNSQIKVGDSINLISGGTVTGGTTGVFYKGISQTMDVNLTDGSGLTATVTKMSGMSDQSKSLVETRAAAAAVGNGAADMLAGTGMANASEAGAGGNGKYAPFAAMGGSSFRYDSGSYVDTQGVNIGLGFAKTIDNEKGKLTYGPVFSYGKSNYDSYLDSGVHGEGDVKYRGLGWFMRQEKDNGHYYEGMLSGGRIDSNYSSRDLVGADSVINYDSNASSYGIYLGSGKKTAINDRLSQEIYGQYFGSRLGSDDVKLTSGETYHFDSVNSNRLRLGGRYINEYSEKAEIYYGAAVEYEFSGNARASYQGMDTASPSLKGGSAMLEVGWKIKPSEKNPMEIDLGVNGWTGKKEGWRMNANLNWSF